MRLAVVFLCMAAATGVSAQEAVPEADPPERVQPEAEATDAPVQSPIVTLNQERLFTRSLFGQRVQAETEAAYQELAAENRRIEAELEAEERRLTELRPTMPAGEFRLLAEAFDARVGEIRRTQENRNRQIAVLNEEAYQAFRSAAIPVLANIMGEFGAEIIIEARSTFLSTERIDITDEALAQIDAVLGDGQGGAVPEGEGQDAPAPGGASD